MKKMLFSFPQSNTHIINLPNGKYDVTILQNEELVTISDPEKPESVTQMYQYDGNQFRTVYELTEEEILSDIEKWLNYDSSGEPTLEEIEHDNSIIDQYTLELMEAGLI